MPDRRPADDVLRDPAPAWASALFTNALRTNRIKLIEVEVASRELGLHRASQTTAHGLCSGKYHPTAGELLALVLALGPDALAEVAAAATGRTLADAPAPSVDQVEVASAALTARVAQLNLQLTRSTSATSDGGRELTAQELRALHAELEGCQEQLAQLAATLRPAVVRVLHGGNAG